MEVMTYRCYIGVLMRMMHIMLLLFYSHHPEMEQHILIKNHQQVLEQEL